MKKLLITTLIALQFATAFSKSYLTLGDRNHLRFSHKKGQVSLHGGIGLVGLQFPTGFDYVTYGDVTREYQSVMPNAGAEYAITDAIGIGVFFNSFKSRIAVQDLSNPNNADGFDYKSTSILLKGSYHIYTGRNLIWLDPYTTAMLGFHALRGIPISTDNGILEPEKGGFAFGVYFGANFYFFQNLGMYIETGYGVNLANAGLTLRF